MPGSGVLHDPGVTYTLRARSSDSSATAAIMILEDGRAVVNGVRYRLRQKDMAVLNAIYPIAIILIVVEFLPGRFQRTSVWRLSILFTAIQSIPAALPFGPLSTLMNALPLSSLGFGWLLPALIGIGAGLLI